MFNRENNNQVFILLTNFRNYGISIYRNLCMVGKKMYVLIDIRGRHYKAEKGSVLKLDKVNSEIGDKLEFDKVMMVGGDNEVKIGYPYLDGIKVEAIVESQMRDKKVVVFKYKKRKNYRRTKGHKQPYTLVKVTEIAGI